MNKVYCSTGALIGQPNNRDYRLIRKYAKKLECDGFEFMMYSTWYGKEKEIIKELIDTGLSFPIMHCEKHIGEYLGKNEDGEYKTAKEKFEKNCIMAKSIGAKKMVMHLWDGTYSDKTFENNLKGYAEVLKIANQYNIDILIENVVCNCSSPMIHWMELVKEYPDIHFIFDTKMAQFHNELELIYEEKNEYLWKKHIKHLHINDYAGGYKEWDKLKTLPIGVGNIDFYRFFSYIDQTQYNGDYTVEATAFSENGEVNCDMLNECFKFIKKNKKSC